MFFTLILTAMMEILNYVMGDTGLIEICPSPWKPYHLSGFSVGASRTKACHDKCTAKAFYNNDGQFVCFNRKEAAKIKPAYTSKSKLISCKCGYFTKCQRQKWIPCDTPAIDTSIKECREHCKWTTVYFYNSRQNTVVHCEMEIRNEFYKVKGELGEVFTDPNNSKSSYRLCTCGVADMKLKQIKIEEENSLDSVKVFVQCEKPWDPLNLLAVRTLETCEVACRDICEKKRGFFYHGKPFCFEKSVPAKRHTSHLGGTNGTCGCGYTKNINKNPSEKTLEFVPCQPPIIEYNLNRTACVEFCSKSIAYIFKNARKILNVRCIFQSDIKIHRPVRLIGKCDENIYDRINSSKRYTKCFCGLNSSLESKIYNNLIERVPDIMKGLGISWNAKKKRSTRNYYKVSNNK